MITLDFDIAVVGGGFSGTLTARILAKQGRTVLLVDSNKQPRFAIGESSVPDGNMVLASLADRYELSDIRPLAKYGSWKQKKPGLACGLKRGFSYFFHSTGADFDPGHNHENELLVAASSSDALGDTHWFREELDFLFLKSARDAGVTVHDGTTVDSIANQGGHWQLELGSGVSVKAKWVIDASGRRQVTSKLLGQHAGDSTNDSSATGLLHTNTSAIYSHFEDISGWHTWMTQSHNGSKEYPFNSDHSAQHHLLDDRWLWMLRFDNGITSAGLVIPNIESYPTDVTEIWDTTINQYPSVKRLFHSARLASTPQKLIGAGRMQFLNHPLQVEGLVRLPSAFGFIDPLHSTGIAHNLIAIERTVLAMEKYWESPSLQTTLHAHELLQFEEFLVSDLMIDTAYKCMGSPSAFEAATMLYFAAAIRYEENRMRQNDDSMGFLCAHEPFWKSAAEEVHKVCTKLDLAESKNQREIESRVRNLIEPYNTAGLCRTDTNSMYAYTAAE